MLPRTMMVLIIRPQAKTNKQDTRRTAPNSHMPIITSVEVASKLNLVQIQLKHKTKALFQIDVIYSCCYIFLQIILTTSRFQAKHTVVHCLVYFTVVYSNGSSRKQQKQCIVWLFVAVVVVAFVCMLMRKIQKRGKNKQ